MWDATLVMCIWLMTRTILYVMCGCVCLYACRGCRESMQHNNTHTRDINGNACAKFAYDMYATYIHVRVLCIAHMRSSVIHSRITFDSFNRNMRDIIVCCIILHKLLLILYTKHQCRDNLSKQNICI